MAAWVRSGRSVGSIARELDDEGVPRPRGGTAWRRASIRSILTSPTIAGLRSHGGEIQGPAVWDGILPVDEWERVRRILSSEVTVIGKDGRRHSVKRTSGGTRRSYLLTGGIAVCGRCGRPLHAGLQARRKGRHPAYVCRPVTDAARGACGALSIGAPELESYVVDRLMDRLATGALSAALIVGDGCEEQAAALALAGAQERLADIAGMFGAGEISREEWEAMRAPAQARAAAARAQLRGIPGSGVEVPSADVVPERWAEMDIGQRRAIVERCVEVVRVSPAVPGTKRFDPDRVEVVWRG